MYFETIKHGSNHGKIPILACKNCGCISKITLYENEPPPHSTLCPECGYAEEVEYITKEKLENIKMEIEK